MAASDCGLEEHPESAALISPEVMKYTCKICAESYTDIRELELHMEEHYGDRKPYKCQECSEWFLEQWELFEHSSVHSYAQLHFCTICESYIELELLEEHKLSHNSNGQTMCSVCGRNFACRAKCRRHMLIHTGEKPFVCEICQKSFNQLSVLNAHKRTHTKEKAFKCTHCEKSFSKSVGLANHVKIHIGLESFICYVCNRLFMDPASLEAHKVKHSEIYQCEICEKIYVRHEPFLKHLTTHENDYACEVCGKAFSLHMQLLRHMKQHVVKPFECPGCSARFVRSCNLNNHMMVSCPVKDLVDTTNVESCSPMAVNSPKCRIEHFQCMSYGGSAEQTDENGTSCVNSVKIEQSEVKSDLELDETCTDLKEFEDNAVFMNKLYFSGAECIMDCSMSHYCLIKGEEDDIQMAWFGGSDDAVVNRSF